MVASGRRSSRDHSDVAASAILLGRWARPAGAYEPEACSPSSLRDGSSHAMR